MTFRLLATMIMGASLAAAPAFARDTPAPAAAPLSVAVDTDPTHAPEDVLNLEDFKDTSKVGKFLERFTSMWELENPSGSYDPMTAFQPSSLTGISTDLLISINNLKLGGR